jgi:hypothetical protein
VLKIQKQAQPLSYATITRQMIQKKGVLGVLDGFLPWGFIQCLTKGAVFSFGHAQSMYMLHDNENISREVKEVLSGGMGGFIQGVFMSPLLLLKTRVCTSQEFKMMEGFKETTRASFRIGSEVIKREGLAGLMKGAPLFSVKRFADWTSRYFFVVVVENLLEKSHKDGHKKLSANEKAFASLMGGTLSALATIPMDVMVATTQKASKAGEKVSPVQVFRDVYKEGGMGAVLNFGTRGTMARVVHVALTTLMMKTATTAVYDAIYRK